LNVPARVAQPKNLLGMVDQLHSPAYATSIGLLRWALSDNQIYQPRGIQREWGKRMGSLLKALLPG
jgi:cell division protein FtsA